MAAASAAFGPSRAAILCPEISWPASSGNFQKEYAEIAERIATITNAGEKSPAPNADVCRAVMVVSTANAPAATPAEIASC